MMQTKKYLILMDSLKITDYNAEINEIESITPGIAGLATTAPLNAVENDIPNVSNLVKKQVMMEKYQALGLTILTHLIIEHFCVKYLTQKYKKMN